MAKRFVFSKYLYLLICVLLFIENIEVAEASSNSLPLILVARSSQGIQGNHNSEDPSISADGRYVAYQSISTNLVPADTNGISDIFIYDNLLSITERVSISSSGIQGNGSSFSPFISGDGRYIVFESAATNLVSGDTNGYSDVFLHDRLTRITEMVSLSDNETKPNFSSYGAKVTDDGRYVFFTSQATNLVAVNTGGYRQVYVRDRINGTTKLISATNSGQPGNDVSKAPSITPDGRFVAFDSIANNLIANDNNSAFDIFVRDNQTGIIERVSVSSTGEEANGAGSIQASISADGRFVTFDSHSTNLVTGDVNGYRDVFIRDRSTGSTELVSVSTEGLQGNGNYSYATGISADGRYVVFTSNSTNLIYLDTNATIDVFIRDRELKTTKPISISNVGILGDQVSSAPSISNDGRFVAFKSKATNLVEGDTNGYWDVFLRDRCQDEMCSGFDLDVSNSQFSLAASTMTKQEQPQNTVIYVPIQNIGTEEALNVTVGVYDGVPTGGMLLGYTIVNAIPAQSTYNAKIDIVTSAPDKYYNLYARAIADGQDVSMENNESQMGTPFYTSYARTGDRIYKFDPDTFNFPNWEASSQDIQAELIKLMFLSAYPSLWEFNYGPWIYEYFADSGHCYGMSSASIVYWDTPTVKPVFKNTFAMDPSEAVADIRNHHTRQLIFLLWIKSTSQFNPQLQSPFNAYISVRQRLSGSNPTPSIFTGYINPTLGHAVVAYKVVEIGESKYVFVYDNNHPMSMDPNIKESANYLTFNTNSNLFEYGDYPGGFTQAVASVPIRDLSEFTVEMIEDIVKYIRHNLIRSSEIRAYFKWVTATPTDSISAINAGTGPQNFLITDSLGNQLGYAQGVLINEIPGGEFYDWETSYYLSLPADNQYSLTMSGDDSATYTFSLLIPSTANIVREIVFTDFIIPSGETGTTLMGRKNTEERIYITNGDPISPTVDLLGETYSTLYLPYVSR